MEKTVKYLYKSDLFVAYFSCFGHSDSKGVERNIYPLLKLRRGFREGFVYYKGFASPRLFFKCV